jgi:hypothetical protein
VYRAQGSAVVLLVTARCHGELEQAIVHCSEAVAIAEARLGADPASVALKRMKLGRLLAWHGDHAKARAQYLAAAASAEALHAKDVLMGYLIFAGAESLALDDAPAAIDQYRRGAEVAGELGKPGEEVRLFARAGLGRALAAAQQDAEAITELEWALPRLESLPSHAESAPRGSRSPRRCGVAMAATMARARVLAFAARESVVAQKAALKDSDALRAIKAKDLDEVIARIDSWVSKHR